MFNWMKAGASGKVAGKHGVRINCERDDQRQGFGCCVVSGGRQGMKFDVENPKKVGGYVLVFNCMIMGTT